MDQIPSEVYRVQVSHKADPFNELSEARENHQHSVKEIQHFVLQSSHRIWLIYLKHSFFGNEHERVSPLNYLFKQLTFYINSIFSTYLVTLHFNI